LHAYAINKKNNSSLWKDAIEKEMLNIGVAFEVLLEEQKAPVGWKKVNGNFVVSQEDQESSSIELLTRVRLRLLECQRKRTRNIYIPRCILPPSNYK
jgi:hypothetical protein